MKKFMIYISAFLYFPTISLFILPLVYGKTYIGIIIWVPIWIINIIGSLLLWIFSITWRDKYHNFLNKLSNYVMTLQWRTVSNELGVYIDQKESCIFVSWVVCLHCRIIGTFDPNGWHCSPKAKSLI